MKQLQGRKLLAAEITEAEKALAADKKKALVQVLDKGHCQRCGSSFSWKLFQLPDGRGYCPYCLTLGRVTAGDFLYLFPVHTGENKNVPVHYPHPLSTEQARLSAWVVQRVQKAGDSLLWAVTGAGKTEMVFQGLAEVLAKGQKVAWVSPRVDVCLEIAPRLKRSFPTIQQTVLHGKSSESYQGEQLVVCTTHQLLRFHEAFHLLVIDEVDAFPFTSEIFLQQGARLAVAKKGHTLLLTATPTTREFTALRQGKLSYEVLTSRFHGQPLPVPQFLWLNNWRQKLLQKMPIRLKKILATQRWLIFCPEIRWLQQAAKFFSAAFPTKKVVSIYANDPQRHEKVVALRLGEYDFIFTTTILERGVTLENIHVLVLGSNQKIFTKEVLIQIAGRVGRSKDYPTGFVYWVHDGVTRSMVQAKREIQQLNRLAQEKGLLLATKEEEK